MSRTIHRPARRERDGFTLTREPRPAPRREGTRYAAVRSELVTERQAGAVSWKVA